MKINEIITEGKPGLWANIHAKRKRGAKMRKKGAPGAPTEKALKAAQAGSKNESVDQGVAEAAGSPSFRKGQKVLIVKQGVIATVTKIDKKWGYITVQTNDGRMAQIDERQFNQIKAYHGPMLSPSVTSEITELLNNGTSPDDVADIMGLPVEVVAEFMPNQQGVAGRQLEETYDNDDEFFETYGVMEYNDEMINESEYQGRKVTLNKPFRTSGGPKKFSVYVKNEKGNVVKVNFGDPKSKIKKHIPGRRANFRARHNCDTPGPKTSARYWSCRNW